LEIFASQTVTGEKGDHHRIIEISWLSRIGDPGGRGRLFEPDRKSTPVKNRPRHEFLNALENRPRPKSPESFPKFSV
jgi:hypothetical protein